MAGRGAPEAGRDKYFIAPNPIIAGAIVFGLFLVYCNCFSPHFAPHQYLGPLGILYRFLAFEAHPFWKYSLFAVALSLHVGESLYALYLTGQKGITDPTTRFKWWISTFICGILSLRHLLQLKKKPE